MTATTDAGFTLIEALVAMAVLAVAAAGFVRATEGHIDTVAGLEARAAAGWVADNRLAAARVPGVAADSDETILRHGWHTTIAPQASDDPDIAALTVSATDGKVGAVMRGFADRVAPVPPPASALPRAAS